MSPRPASVSLLALALAGCHACGEDHPYVPFAIGSGAGAALDASAVVPEAGVVAVDARGDPFAGEPSVAAPPGLTRWSLDGVTLDAPEGRVFANAVVRDFDGDGAKDAFALVRPADGNDPGEVVYYRGSAAASPLAVAATFAPGDVLVRDPASAPVDRLVWIGGRMVLAELGGRSADRGSTAPSRWIAVIAGGAAPAVRLAVAIVDPPGAAALSVDADARDRDGDGRPDVALRVTLAGGSAPLEPGPRVSAVFAWLDRSAGLSRDRGATESSFASLAASTAARAARTKEAPSVPGTVAQVRALWSAACSEGGRARVVGGAGAGPIVCGVGRELELAGLAETRAYATMRDATRAVLALDRAQHSPATRTPSRTAEATAWLAPIAPTANVRRMQTVAAVPVVSRAREPAWGALAFEASGRLLVRTLAGVVRVDPDAGEGAATDVAEWAAPVASPDGATRWTDTYDPCDGSPLRATFEASGGDDVRNVPLPVAPLLGARCEGSRGAAARAIPVAWGPGGLEAVVEGHLVLVSPDLSRASPLAAFLDQVVTPGAPRSPDGKGYVIPTGAGLFVRRATGARLLRAKELDGTYGDQRDCAVSDDLAHVACVRAGMAWIGAWDAPP